VTPIDPAHLESLEGVNAADLGGTIDVSSTLEDAMALMMREDKPMVGVTQKARFLGVLTPNGVHRMLRASVHADGG
jgi:osmoprotectant transport system ATP-binding protein